MRVFLSTDFEGTAGIVDWEQAVGPSTAYDAACRLVLGEVNAAIDGAAEGGATSFLVNDAHAAMRNLPPGELRGGASYLAGRHKPLYMMEGLDDGFDAVFLVSYHASAGAERGVLGHTYNPRAVHEVRLNGAVVGESGPNALVALHHRVPVVLLTGDDVTADESRALFPGAELAVVKRAVGRHAAESLHPDAARQVIREAARRATASAVGAAPPAIALPARLDVTLRFADLAEQATWLRGVERTGPRSVALEDDEPLRLFRTFVTLVALTRTLAGFE